MDIQDVLARNLRRLRAERGLTQEQLADKVGLSERYIGSIERATVKARITVVDQIAKGLGIDPGELIHRNTP